MNKSKRELLEQQLAIASEKVAAHVSLRNTKDFKDYKRIEAQIRLLGAEQEELNLRTALIKTKSSDRQRYETVFIMMCQVMLSEEVYQSIVDATNKRIEGNT